MPNRKVFWVCCIAFISLTVMALLAGPGARAQAQAKDFLENARAQIDVPGPGEIAHYSYTLYRRMPPSQLEPSDHYHMPYSELWPSLQYEDTWLDIGPNGQVTRWRVQLRSADGTLVQDLLLNGNSEMDYFVHEGRAIRLPGESRQFRDDRIALIEDFLENEQLSHRENIGIHGQPVVSVYNAPIVLPAQQSAETIEAALLTISSPFVADLRPTSQGMRIDFDPSTNLPIAVVNVVWDESGAEHITAYRTLSEPVVLSRSSAEVDGIFRLDIPAQAFSQSYDFTTNSTIITDLSEIAAQTDYPIFLNHEPVIGFSLKAASLTVPASGIQIPNFVRGLQRMVATGAGVETLYVNESTQGKIVIVQGPTQQLTAILQQTVPTWTHAEQQAAIAVGNMSFPGWRLLTQEADKVIYVIETNQTLLYIEGTGVTIEELQQFLLSLYSVN